MQLEEVIHCLPDSDRVAVIMALESLQALKFFDSLLQDTFDRMTARVMYNDSKEDQLKELTLFACERDMLTQFIDFKPPTERG